MGTSIVNYAGKGSNATCLTLNGLELYYSYGTIIGYRHHGVLVVAINEWSATTEKHINCIPGVDKAMRIPHEELMEAISSIKVSFVA